MNQQNIVLLVDDRPENLVALTTILKSDNRLLVSATSGNEALGLALKYGNDISVIVLDVMMPGMDGFEMAQILGSHSGTKRIPIIFLSAMSPDSQKISEGYKTGAIDFLSKPIDPIIIESKVKLFCDLKSYEINQAYLMKKLETTHEKLKEIDRLKSAFLATASHELRTPLAIIQEFVALVHDEITGPINDDQRDCLLSAQNNCIRLGDLVNDLLDLQKIQSGKLKLNFVSTDVNELFSGCVREMNQLVKRKGQKIVMQCQESLPPICGDKHALTQVLVNLLGNASKFSPEGTEILVDAKMQGPLVIIKIIDHGPGIAEADQEKIFRSFTQVGRQDSMGNQGTGLGLSIAKKIVALHAGQLQVKSTLGHGATFFFCLSPMKPALELQFFINDRMSSTPVDTPDQALVLMKQSNPGPANAADLENLRNGLEQVLRGNDDEVFVAESVSVVGALAPVPNDQVDHFLRRVSEGMQGPSGSNNGLSSENISWHVRTLSADSPEGWIFDFDEIEFKIFCTPGV
ncbi:MAG: response regulator [bacterium]|nr:response regulator [bacterium]